MDAARMTATIPGQQDINGHEPRPETYVEEIHVQGSTQMPLDFGGKHPMSATVTISGKAVVDGFYRKGDRLRGTVELVVTGVSGKDTIDKPTGIVVDAVQAHTAKIVDLVLDDS